MFSTEIQVMKIIILVFLSYKCLFIIKESLELSDWLQYMFVCSCAIIPFIIDEGRTVMDLSLDLVY